ncbi:3-hydroxy-3-methylglutaryl-CoA reductase [Candidatus Woesebacteria bacterium]|nr:3-hydroxy-3-methylglutaryl-CoA reductase [Candidatus Woesebacteria bacterium]
MSSHFSLYIRDENLSESEKLEKRQAIVKNSRVGDFKELFNINFPVDRTGTTNCENMIGSVEIPMGLAGPVKVNNFVGGTVEEITDVKNGLFIPLATTEGALVASINRGCKAINLSDSLSVFINKVGMARALVFKCENNFKAHEFSEWMNKNIKTFAQYCESTSNHLKFLSHQSFIRGRHVYLRFSFDTDEAMGMNMVTIALKYAWNKIKEDHVNVKLLSLSGNVCTDKKDSVLNRMFGRGFNVEVEVFLSKEILAEIFDVTAKDLVRSHVAKNLVGSNVAGSMAQNMHVANALAAFYIATGQDPAHVVGGSEASVTFEEENDGVYVALTLPTISVGSVGGGTWLPKQSQARSLIISQNMDEAKSNSDVESKVEGTAENKAVNVTKDTGTENITSAEKKSASSMVLALTVGVAALAGEISGLCALTNQSLASAHENLARCNVNLRGKVKNS